MPLRHIPILTQDQLAEKIHDRCYVFGPYGSGTNLLRAYIEKHFRCDCRQNHKVWKHVFNWEAAGCKRPADRHDALRLIILKHPIFWMGSMVKSPYNFRAADGGKFSDPCAEILWKRRGRKRKFRDAMSYWEATVSHYLSDPYFQSSTYLILYEDLLYRPVQVLRQIAKLIRRKPAPFKPIYTSAKSHCNSSDRAKALRKYSLANRERARQGFGFPKEELEFVEIWKPCDVWISSSKGSISKDRAKSMKHACREKHGGKRHFKQRFNRDGTIV